MLSLLSTVKSSLTETLLTRAFCFRLLTAARIVPYLSKSSNWLKSNFVLLILLGFQNIFVLISEVYFYKNTACVWLIVGLLNNVGVSFVDVILVTATGNIT